MRRARLGLRAKIAAALAAVCIGVVAALGIMLYRASEDMEAALVDQIVVEELDSLVERGVPPNGPAPESGPNLQYYVARTPADYERIPQPLRALGVGQHSVGSGIGERRVGVRDVAGTRYVVAYDAGPHEMRERRYKILLASTVGAGAVVALVLGYWIAGLLTRQLSELARKVPELMPHEPHAALERSEQEREVAVLARALDRYHGRMLEMIRREQEFTADVSHELRTPLTAIRTSCELLATEPSLSEKGRARLAMVATAAEQMTERIEALLYLARGSAPPEPEPVRLLACVNQAAESCRDEIARKGLAFEAPISPEAEIRVDRKAFQVVVSNLVRNAVRYTERGHVRVTYDGHRLTVSDSGAGMPASQLPLLFDRYYRGHADADGIGLGLAIVRRVCESLGWTIEVKSELGAGSAFSIQLS